MTPDVLYRIAVGCTLGLIVWIAATLAVRYLRRAWVMGRVSYLTADVFRDAPDGPGDVPLTPHATFWWALRRALRPGRTQRQLAFYAATRGHWEPWMGQPAVR